MCPRTTRVLRPNARVATSVLTPHEQGEEARLKEEGVHAFHAQSVAHDRAGTLGEARPVRGELELERDASDDSEGEVDAKDADPEARGLVPARLTRAQRHGLHGEDEQRQAHRQLWEEVVESGREGELQPVQVEGGIHGHRAYDNARAARIPF